MPTATMWPGTISGARMNTSTARFSRKGKRAIAQAVGKATAALATVTTTAIARLLASAPMIPLAAVTLRQ